MKTFIILLLLSSTSLAEQSQKAPNTHTTGGRYQLIQLSDFRRDQFLLDTQTGQIWSQQCLVQSTIDSMSCGYGAWFRHDIEGLNATQAQIFKKQKEIEIFNAKKPAATGHD